MQINSFEGIEDVFYLPSESRGIERSCVDQIAGQTGAGTSERGIERIEARLRGKAYSPHRHDTYALGLTLEGVQTFRYRGVERFSLPGNIIVLHPDEVHDGAAGTEMPLLYRMVYLPPALISAAFGYSRPLPFVQSPVIMDLLIHAALSEVLDDLEKAPDGLLMDDALTRISDGLARHENRRQGRRIKAAARRAVLQARDLLEADFNNPLSSADLEAATGLDRYELSRHFRNLLGTSPHRYLVLRRLRHARQLIRHGSSLASAAAEAGFADQAHFTRHFRKAYGITPVQWVVLQRWA